MPTAKNQAYNVDAVADLLSGIMGDVEKKRTVPILDDKGAFTGQYYDPKTEVVPNQPQPRRFQAHLEYLQAKSAGGLDVQQGEQFPEFDPYEQFQSEGFFNSIGNVLRSGWQQSLTGTAESWLTGQPPSALGSFNPEKQAHWQPNVAEQVESQIASFAMPVDVAALYAGGGAGALLGEGVAKIAGRAALAEAGGGMAARGAATVAKKLTYGAVHSGTTFGTYEGARAAFEGRPVEEIAGATGKGFLVGSIFGVVGKGAGLKVSSPSLKTMAEAGGEIFTLGTIVPVVEGRTPTIEDLGNAAGFIAGLRSFGYLGEMGARKFAGLKMRAEQDVRAAVDAGEAPDAAVRRLANDAILSQPERFDPVFGQRVRTASTRMTQEGVDGKVEIGTLGEFIKDPKVREVFSDHLDTKIVTRSKMPTEVANALRESGGGEEVGWIEGLPGPRPEIVLSSKHPEEAGLTIIHEAEHLLRNGLGRPITGEAAPVAERSAEKVSQFVAGGGTPSVPKEKLRQAVVDRSSQRRWEDRIIKEGAVRLPADNLKAIGSAARPVVTELMKGSPVASKDLIVLSEPSETPISGDRATLYGAGRKGVLIGESAPGGRGKAVWTVLDVTAGTEAEKIASIDVASKQAAETGRPLYLSKSLENTSLFNELQRTGKISKARVGRLYKIGGVLERPVVQKVPVGLEDFKPPSGFNPMADDYTSLGVASKRPVKPSIKTERLRVRTAKEKAIDAERQVRAQGVVAEMKTEPDPEIPFRRNLAGREITKREDETATARTYRMLHNLNPKAAEAVKRVAHSVRPVFLDQTRKTVNTPEAKGMVDATIKADTQMNVDKGRFTEEAMGFLHPLADGTFSSPKKRAANLKASHKMADDIEAGRIPAVRVLMDEVADYIREVKPEFRGVKNYLSRRLRDDVKRKMYRDAAWLDDELMKVKEELTAAKDRGEKLDMQAEMDKALLSRLSKTSKEFQDQVTFTTDPQTGQIKRTHQFIKTMRRELASQMTDGATFLHKRELDFLPSYYERDVRILIPQYIAEVTKWRAQVDHFGRNAETLNGVLTKLRGTNFEDATKLSKIISMWNGSYEVEHGLKPNTQAIVDGYVALQVATKIGLGGATMLNLAQPLISIIPEVGAWHFIKGGLSLFDPAVRKEIRTSGAATKMAIQAIAGNHPGGTLGKIADFTTTVSGFRGINKGLQYLAAATIREAMPSWQTLAGRTGTRADWARKRLDDFGINWQRPLAEQEKAIAGAMYRFATDSQLQKNVLNEPFFFNDPRTRPLVLFKRFGYRQANYMKDMLNREVGRGNVAPIIRLAVGGWLGGTGVIWGLNKAKSILSGEPYYRQDDSFFEELSTDLATIGAFGMVSDMANVTNITRLPDAVKFAISPVMVSDVETMLESWSKVTGDWQRYGDGWLATRRNLNTLAYPFGTYPRALAKRAMTGSQKFERLDYRKNKELGEVYRLILEGNADAASNRIANWNSMVDEDLQLQAQDLSLQNINRWIENRAKGYALAVSKEKTPEYRKAFQEKRVELREQLRAGKVGIRTLKLEGMVQQ